MKKMLKAAAAVLAAAFVLSIAACSYDELKDGEEIPSVTNPADGDDEKEDGDEPSVNPSQGGGIIIPGDNSGNEDSESDYEAQAKDALIQTILFYQSYFGGTYTQQQLEAMSYDDLQAIIENYSN